MVYLITVDSHHDFLAEIAEQNIFSSAIKKLFDEGDLLRLNSLTWLVKTKLSIDETYEKLHNEIESTHYFLIVDFSEYQVWDNKETVAFIQSLFEDN